MMSLRVISKSSQEDTTSSDDEDVLRHEFDPLTADVYSWAVSMVLRDIVWLHEGTYLACERSARIINSMVLIFGTGALQTFLLLAVLNFAEKHVGSIRALYGDYETLMYPNHTEPSVNGYARGVPGYRQDDRFLLLDSNAVSDICEIPLSHPGYLAAILFIWSCTCLVEMRSIFELWYRLIVATPTVASPRQMLQRGEEEHSAYITGLTPCLKIGISAFIQIPRLLTLSLLLWLGCRWLTATVGLEEVLLNGLALEFMLMLKELFYRVCTSHRNQLATQRLFVKPFRDKNSASCITFFDTQIWGLIGVVWTVAYIFHLQAVLPNYRWDVHDLCIRYQNSTGAASLMRGSVGHRRSLGTS